MKKILTLLFSLFCLSTFAFAEERVTLSGDVTYEEDYVLPDGSQMSVSIINETDPVKASLVTESYTLTGAKPYTFNLTYDKSTVPASNTFILDANIKSPEGRLLFATKERVLLNLSQTPDEVVQVEVVKVGDQ